MDKPKPPCILYLSSYPPRECGIATFTQDLVNAIDKEYAPEIKSKIFAINDNGTSIYNYPKKVALQLRETEIENYIDRAYEINKMSDVKLVNIQHEFGLFGGDWGDYILPFLELLKKPVISTFHTVLPDPEDEKVLRLTRAIAEKSYKIVVMTKHAADILHAVYKIPKSKIAVIPHGVHHIVYPSKSRAKKKLNLSGRIILSTFGLLNSDKGIEYAIEALPEVVKNYPHILYLVLGQTHPVVRREHGEAYRNKLKRLVKHLQLEDHVKFYDKYLPLGELIDFLKATDIYLSPTLNPLQAVSGTISYAMACACPIVATANQYCQDVISRERGILVDFHDAEGIKKGILEILGDKKLNSEMKKNAYFYSRHMTWQNVAISYFSLFNEFAKIIPKQKGKLPPLNLSHIYRMTDDFGMLQFCNHTKPDPLSGYCEDDNVRALLAFAMYYEMKPNSKILQIIEKYLNFIKFTQKANGKFYNFVSYNKTFIDEAESEDAFGRTIWALGYFINSQIIPENFKKKAKKIINKAQKWVLLLNSLRAISFTLIGLNYLYQTEKKEQYLTLINSLSEKLLESYISQTAENDQKDSWQWFENCLTYSNFKLPEALYRSYQTTGKKDYLDVAEKTMHFLLDVTFEKDFFSPIGQDGWYFKNGERAYFDQQPEDASSAVEALTAAYFITKNKNYRDLAETSYTWFLGKNHLSQMVYDEATGGCYDGLGKYSLNFNQGAESTISYLFARLTIEQLFKYS